MKGEEKEVILSAKNITLKYQSRFSFFKRFEHTALDNVSFDLYRGETMGILGRNGCGKSSLLKILAGIINPTSGKLECDRSVKRALLALGLGFRPDLSGRQNALVSAMLQGLCRREAQALLERINQFAELGDFFDQPVKTYSAGMRARLGFSTAITIEVDILLVDEVLSVGDMHFSTKAQAYMRERVGGEQTVVFVSHNPQQIDKICDRTVWIESGVIQEQGDTPKVAQSYNCFMRELADDKARMQRQ